MDKASRLIIIARVLLLLGMVKPISALGGTTLPPALTEISYNEACTSDGETNQCKTTDAKCLQNKCLCEDTHYHDSISDSCLTKIEYNGTCTSDGESTQCKTTDAKCRDNKCLCDVTHYHNTTSDSCLTKISYNEACTSDGETNQCKTTDAKCLQNKCLCEDTHYHNATSDSCLPKIDYARTCADYFQCKTMDAKCIEGTCQCDETHYHYSKDNNDSCTSRPTHRSLNYFVFTSGFQLAWTPGNYTIDIKVFNLENKTYECARTTPGVCLVTIVESGTKFFIVYKTTDNTNGVQSIERNMSLCSAPGVPPQPSDWIRWENNVTLRWTDDKQHNCQHHTIEINPPPTDGNSTITIPENAPLQEITFDNLIGGTLYTVTITAVAGSKNASRTSEKYTRPEEISGAKVLDKTDSSLDISVDYNGNNRDKIEYRVYIDTPVTSSSSQSCLSDTNTDDTTNMQCASTSNFTLTGLQDGTLHDLNIYTWLEGLPSVTGFNFQNYTRPKGPTITSFESITTSGFTVTFDGNDGHFDSFTVQLCLDTATNCPEVMNTNDAKYIASNLTAGTKYKIIVNTVLDNGLASILPYSNSSFTRPNKLASIDIPDNTLHETNATIVIQEIDNIYNHMEIDLFDDNDSNTGKLETYNTKTITGLTPGTKYRVEVFTATITGLRSSDSVRKVFYTRPKTPDAGNPTERGLDYIKFTLGDNTGTFDHLDITDEEGKLIETVASGGNSSFTAQNLAAGTRYAFRVFTNYSSLRSDGYFPMTTFTQPGQISNLGMTQVTNSTMSVVWTAPDVGMVTAYHSIIFCIGPNDDSQVKAFNKKSSNLIVSTTGLEPGSICNATVTTQINDTNEVILGNPATQTFLNRTLEKGPQDVQAITKTNTTARSITIEWERPSVRNGIITGYVINVMQNSSNVITQILNCTPCSITNTDNDLRTIAKTCANATVCDNAISDKRFRYSIPDLHPFRTYEVSVVAKTSKDGSRKTVSYSTDESVPNGPPNVIINSSKATEITLTWIPPIYGERNGIITKYNISYTFLQRTCSEDVGENVTHSVLLNDNSTIWTLTRLDPYTDHNVQIQAFTSVGVGPFSEAVTISTKQSKPSEVRELKVSTTTNESISLSWFQPCRPNGEINEYKVYLTNTDKNTQTSFTSVDKQIDIEDNILPYSNYSITVTGNTIMGEGNVTKEVTVRTGVGVPKIPQNVGAKNVSSTALNITWTTLKLYTGPTHYNVVVTDSVNTSQQIPPQHVTGFWAQTATIHHLDEYWLYSVKVIAETDAGRAESSSIVIRTDEDVPEEVKGLDVTPEADVTKPRTIKVKWNLLTAREQNGILKGYTVRYGIQNGFETNNTLHKTESEYVIKNVNPGRYTIKVSASTSKGYGKYSSQSATLKAGAPIKVEETPNDPLIRPASIAVNDDETQIAIELPLTTFLCTTSNGQPNEWGVIVSEDSVASDKPFFGSKAEYDSRKNSTYKRWVEVKDKTPMPAYIATKPGVYKPCQGSTRKKRSVSKSSGGSFTVGTDGKCSGVAGYCNGELPPGRSFRVKSYVCTSGGCTETMYSRPIWTVKAVKAEGTVRTFIYARDQTVPIVSGVTSVVFVIVVVIIVMAFLKRNRLACFKKDVGSTSIHIPVDSEIVLDRIESTTRRSGPIKLVDFTERVDTMHKNSDRIFADEFKLLTEKSPTHPITAAQAPCNLSKNRYTNMLPFDHSRVKLRRSNGVDDSDYINANYIPGYTSRHEYIATQGPMHTTVGDFWRMVWEQNVDTIVMLTKLVDNGRNKCHKYWSNISNSVYYGSLQVTVSSELNFRNYTIRTIEVKSKNVSKTVQQFCYLKWPDVGCPETPAQVLQFISTVRHHTKRGKQDQSSDPKMIVHCSAGVGGTGTFIAVDTILQYIRDHDKVDIFDIVLRIRNHRLNMVQTEEQYVFIHECIKTFIATGEDESGNKEHDAYTHLNIMSSGDHVYETINEDL